MREAVRCVLATIVVSTLGVHARAQDSGSLDRLTGESEAPLRLTGFGVIDARADGRSRDNSFGAAKLALSLFRELNPYAWVFGQLTAAVSSNDCDDCEKTPTSIEIDNLIFNVTPPRWTAFNVAAGKFDTPLGFERDDEPLNLQASTSFNFELGRPAKMVGVIGRWAVRPRVDVAGWLANGWESDIDLNHGKTAGGRLGVRPSDTASLGAGFLYGPEGRQGDTLSRYLVTTDYAWQPTERWIVAGEVNLAGDRAGGHGTGGRWYGGSATVFRRVADHAGATVRVEAFNDHDGLRTGTPQTLTSLTVAPLYFAGSGGEGIFANVEHTTFRIPRLQLRGEIRFDRSTTDAFDTASDQSSWRVHYIAQLVTTF